MTEAILESTVIISVAVYRNSPLQCLVFFVCEYVSESHHFSSA